MLLTSPSFCSFSGLSAFSAFHVAGGLIHILLIIGIIVLIWHFVAGRRAV